MTIQICQYRFRKIDNLRSQFYRGPTIFHNSFPVYIGHIFINAQENVINLSCNEGGVKDGGSGLSLATALTLDPRARNLSAADYKITSLQFAPILSVWRRQNLWRNLSTGVLCLLTSSAHLTPDWLQPLAWEYMANEGFYESWHYDINPFPRPWRACIYLVCGEGLLWRFSRELGTLSTRSRDGKQRYVTRHFDPLSCCYLST